jgi:hypothetical protein
VNLLNSYARLDAARRDYYGAFTYNTPVMLTVDQSDNMVFIQEYLHDCILHFVSNVDTYTDLMPLNARTREILSICDRYPYRPGTYRTDFVVTADGGVKIIEITARFALNGFIRSGIVNGFAERWASDHQIETQSLYPSFFQALEDYFEGREEIILLKNDSFTEGKYLIDLFGDAGRPLEILDLEDIPRHADRLSSSNCIGQLSHDELFALPNEVLESLMHGNLLNDLRTVLLVHDKRFFCLLWDEAFRENALGSVRSKAFKEFLTPTYTPAAHPELWAKLPARTEQWIVKPTALGMGLGITASTTVNDADWLGVLEACDPVATVFQPYLFQRRFSGMVGDETRRDDYFTGTLLFFQGGYYGPGLFRASSHPVTNVADDRKIAAATLSTTASEIDPEVYGRMMVL